MCVHPSVRWENRGSIWPEFMSTQGRRGPQSDSRLVLERSFSSSLENSPVTIPSPSPPRMASIPQVRCELWGTLARQALWYSIAS